MSHTKYIVPHNKKIKLSSYDTADTGDYTDRKAAEKELRKGVKQLSDLQERLYADNRYAMLLVFQAMDAAGKDSTIEHVMTGVNPQGVQVVSFKQPSAEELDHDFLWRCLRRLPERGNIGIFNRSYYEEVLVVRVHPTYLDAQMLPPTARGEEIWQNRFEDIRNIEQYLSRNGLVILKFFLHVSKEEQARRFLDRINEPDKNWKFSMGDLRERELWDDYMTAYEDMLNHTSTENAPWYVIPADHKWFMRLTVAQIIVDKLQSLDLQYPTVTEAQKAELAEAKQILEDEK